MFTEANTEGFTADQLKVMNAALETRIADGEDEKNASDAINNSWHDGISYAELVSA